MEGLPVCHLGWTYSVYLDAMDRENSPFKCYTHIESHKELLVGSDC